MISDCLCVFLYSILCWDNQDKRCESGAWSEGDNRISITYLLSPCNYNPTPDNTLPPTVTVSTGTRCCNHILSYNKYS